MSETEMRMVVIANGLGYQMGDERTVTKVATRKPTQ